MKHLPETKDGNIDWREMERRQQLGHDIAPIETRKAGVKAAVAAQHQIDTFRNRNYITATQHDSAWRLIDHARTAQGGSGAPLDGLPHSGSQNAAGLTDRQIQAAIDRDNALDAVGKMQRRVLVWALFEERDMTALGNLTGYGNPKAAMGALKLALDSLSAYYKGMK